jgi:hypothetical protein
LEASALKLWEENARLRREIREVQTMLGEALNNCKGADDAILELCKQRDELLAEVERLKH